MRIPLPRILLLLSLLAGTFAEAASPEAKPTPVDSTPWTEAVSLNGSFWYRRIDAEMKEAGVTDETQLTLNLLPFQFAHGPIGDYPADVLDTSITVDPATHQFTEASVTLLREKFTDADFFLVKNWIGSALSYRRDLIAGEEHDLGLIQIMVPIPDSILPTSECDLEVGGKCVIRWGITATVGIDLGFRWMRGWNEGLYAAPTSAITMGVTVFNRFFLGLDAQGSYNMMTGQQQNYAKAKVTGRFGVMLSKDVMLSLNMGWRFYGSRKGPNLNLPRDSNDRISLSIHWNLP